MLIVLVHCGSPFRRPDTQNGLAHTEEEELLQQLFIKPQSHSLRGGFVVIDMHLQRFLSVIYRAGFCGVRKLPIYSATPSALPGLVEENSLITWHFTGR